jgi:hypothetical protein
LVCEIGYDKEKKAGNLCKDLWRMWITAEKSKEKD